MLKIPVYKYIDCENVVVCNRADWDENQPRLQGPPTSTQGDEKEKTLGTGLGWELDGFLYKRKEDCQQSIKYSVLLLTLVVLKLKYSFACFTQ